MEKARIDNVPLKAVTPEGLITSLASQMRDLDQDLTSKSGEVVQAMVLESIAYLHSYFITAPNRKPTMAFMSSDSSLLPIGSRGHASLMPGTAAVAWYPGSGERDWAVILGTRNPIMLDRNLSLPPYLVPASRVGLFDDIVQSLLANLPQQRKNIANASAGRPVDAVSGEWGYTNELGLAIHLGKLMTFMKASETAGLYLYHLDDLVRLWSYNFEHFTAGSERYAYDDESEFTDREGSTPYPWEALGSFGPLAAEALAAQTKESGEGRKGVEELWVEPKYRDQAPIWRRQKFNGFLGGMVKDIIQAPVPTITGNPEQFSRKAAYPGLLDIHQGLDGRYSVRSAKEITFEKIILLPVPKQMKQPADPDGDFRDNFSASGRQWSRTKDGVTYQTPAVSDLEEFEHKGPTGSRIAGLLDYHTYMTKVYGVQGFRLHPKDWLLPDELNSSEDEPSVAHAFNPPVHTEVSTLVTPPDATQYFLDPPHVFNLRIDHRTQVAYYASRSVIKQFDDGSVLIEDGWGAQLKMGHGHATLTAPLDTSVMAGRNFVAMAPSDAIVRAGNSVDITAAKRDVRIKSERNLHMLGGNAGNGGVMIESRGKGDPAGGVGEDAIDGGITLKSTISNVRLNGKKIELSASENLLLAGIKQLLLKAAELSADIPASVFSGTVDAILGIRALSYNGSVLTGSTAPPGVAALPALGVYTPPSTLPSVKVTPAAVAASMAIANAFVTLRTPVQYQLQVGSFIWWEHRWQQYFRRTKEGKKRWNEPVVVGGGQSTMPYPGKALWDETKQFREVQHELFDLETGMPKEYTDIDDKTASGTPVERTIADGYLIASQGRI